MEISGFFLQDLCRAAVRPLLEQRKSKALDIQVTFAADVPDTVGGDSHRLQQIIQNLTSHVIDHALAGPVELQAAVRSLADRQAEIEFRICAMGRGRPDLRVEIARRIVDLMGGTLSYERKGDQVAVGFMVPFAIGNALASPQRLEEPTSGGGFDPETALLTTGGDFELLQELAKLFLDELPIRMSELRAAVGRRDAKGVESVAHSLKGSLGHFGARGCVQAALALEMKGRHGDLADADDRLASFEALLQPFVAELQGFVGSP